MNADESEWDNDVLVQVARGGVPGKAACDAGLRPAYDRGALRIPSLSAQRHTPRSCAFICGLI